MKASSPISKIARRGVEEAIDRTEKLHGDLWEVAKKEVSRDPHAQDVAGMLQSLNDEWSFHRQRVHAFENRVPEGVTLLLFGGAILALAAVGFAGGLGNHRGDVGKYLLVALVAGTIFVVLDLDRSRTGVFQISQEPIVHLKELLNRDAGQSP